MGAVTGDHSFLKTVTMAQINPPINPISISGATSVISRVGRNRLHVQAAVAIAHTNRMPVLFTVPLSVIRLATSIRPPDWPPYCTSEILPNVFAPSAGLDVFISAIVSSPCCSYLFESRRDRSRAFHPLHSF